MKCEKCKKPIKENTDRNMRYCQGHSFFSELTGEEGSIKKQCKCPKGYHDLFVECRGY